MKWASSVSADPHIDAALAAAGDGVRDQLGGRVPDLIVVFVSPHHSGAFEELPQRIIDALGGGLVIGCSAGGVIGGGTEVEQQPGLSLTAAVLPGVELTPFHLDANAPQSTLDPAAWEATLGVSRAASPSFLLLPEPFSFESEGFLRTLDDAFPGSRKIGGLASGGQQPGVNALFLRQRTYRTGLVGVAVSGNVKVDTVVAQGCRPIGQPMFVTKCQRNFVWELDGQPPLRVLQDLYERLSSADQELARHSLFLGIVMKADRQEYRHGDFLIRNLMGTDDTRHALAVGALLEENSVVQFHLRDAHTSAEDLERMLSQYQAAPHGTPAGALLFSCLGRGRHLYGRPDHDTDLFRKHVGAVPLGGFFCNGEIGPVHETTFLHGYTSSFGLFRPRRAARTTLTHPLDSDTDR